MLLPITDAILDAAAELGPPDLRSLDAIHMATARTLNPDLAAIVTYDNRLMAVAAALGIPTISPGR